MNEKRIEAPSIIPFHDLRHSVASNLLAQGFSVVQVQEWLGSENGLSIYTIQEL